MRHKKGMVCMMVQKSSTKLRDMMHINISIGWPLNHQ